MPIATLIGAVFNLFVVSLIIAVVMQLAFKRANKRNLNTIAVLIAVLLPLLNGKMDEFAINLIGALPVWFALNFLHRRYSHRSTGASTTTTEPTS